MAAPSCGIVVPVRNEAGALVRSIPALRAAAGGEAARIVWVCNGCTDDSAAVIRDVAGPGAEVIVLKRPGKAGALQAGDAALGDLFPRLYLDADAWLGPGDVTRLLAPLRDRSADLVAARPAYDLAGVSRASAAIARCWLALPHGREAAFCVAFAVSRAGRARWGPWPATYGDDAFAAANVAPTRRRIVRDAVTTTRPPATFAGWIRARQRWCAGVRQLRAMGLEPPHAPGQRAALIARLCHLRTAPGAAAFLAARLLGGTRPLPAPDTGWVPERDGTR